MAAVGLIYLLSIYRKAAISKTGRKSKRPFRGPLLLSQQFNQKSKLVARILFQVWIRSQSLIRNREQ